MLLASLPRQAGTLWQQLIGVLGWLDAPLRPWFYPVLGMFLVALSLERLDIETRSRIRIAALTGLAVLASGIAVYLIFFLVWPPVEAEEIRSEEHTSELQSLMRI